MILQIRPQVVQKLNQHYRTSHFHTQMSLKEIIKCAEQAMKSKIDIIDYQLNSSIIDKYGIKPKYCTINPFPQEQLIIIQELLGIVEKLEKSSSQTSQKINNQLESLKDHVVKYSTKLKITQKYHKYRLYFRFINIKQAIIFEVLSNCQVFYTIVRERKKSQKEYFMDPLINCYEEIKNKLKIVHSFNQRVIPKKQLRYFQKKNTDKKMKNILFQAVSNRKYKQVKQLIVKGASIQEPGISQRTKREMNCSHRACQLGDLQLSKILHSFKVNWQVKDKQGMTPLHFASQSGNLKLVEFLIEQAKVNLQSRDMQQRNCFYFACTQGDLDIIRYLYKKGADINNKSKLGRSALSKACYLGLIDVVKFLMECQGIILNSADGKGRTALHNSVFGPKGGRQGHKFGTNEKDSPQCTQLLLQNGFDVDCRDIQNNTPLHVAMSSDGIDSIKILLAFNGSLTKLNCYEQTPLMTGAKFGHLESVKVLKEQYGALLTVKDVFNKNLMLLCAKFRQDDGKCTNRVFFYAVDQLLRMAKGNQPLLEKDKNHIQNWQQEIDYTFSELLKQKARVQQQFKYFCTKCKQFNLNIFHISLNQIKDLLSMIKNTDCKQEIELIQYFLCKRTFDNQLSLSNQQFQGFILWIITQNSSKLLDFIGSNQRELRKYLKMESQLTLFQEIGKTVFTRINEIKQKLLTYCLLKLDINWVDYIDNERYDNILHLLVRHKKVGTLIQVLKTLSAIKIQFASNKFVLDLLRQNEEWKKVNTQGDSPLQVLLRSLLLHKNKEGFDPYHLAMLMKDASTSKLLQQKMNMKNLGKSQFQVKQYSIKLQENLKQLQIFNKGFQVQDQLEKLLSLLSEPKSKAKLSQNFHILKEQTKLIDSSVDIDSFNNVWKNISGRKMTEICHVNQIQKLQSINQSKVLGIDIEYFYSDGVTLISIMQLSTLSQDFIIDFLTSAKNHQQSYHFIQSVKNMLCPIAYNQDIVKIMHGSDNDLCVIKAILNISFVNFIDTARIDVDIRKQQNIRGLATLVNDYLNQYMSKDYQVSQWRIRPIPPSMLDYARRDSMVLPFLARKILNIIEPQRLHDILASSCKQAKKNRKVSQLLIRSIQAI